MAQPTRAGVRQNAFAILSLCDGHKVVLKTFAPDLQKKVKEQAACRNRSRLDPRASSCREYQSQVRCRHESR